VLCRVCALKECAVVYAVLNRILLVGRIIVNRTLVNIILVGFKGIITEDVIFFDYSHSDFPLE